ncbi:MAG: DNA polymerase/3'-5' exonuclease PolX [Syntrophales bacterium]|nr:DNA polymerase/3'-5' exonuclease PolX [Syntrophales bacterium]MDD5643272.1 DNA polymerase/3'-5' exonuclease PolX [Syntrophales bacterium]
MKNKEIARIFNEISEYLEMDGVAFKPYAYQKAAMTLENLPGDLDGLYHQGGLKALKKIPGIGESMAQKIEEYLTTGKIRYYEDLKAKMPINLEEIVGVEGVGPKKAKVLFEQLGIRTLEELEEAAQAHKIAPLFGFGPKTEENILQGIGFLKTAKGRFLIGDILPLAQEILEKLRGLKEVEQADVAGSLRRRKETIGDVDFLVISNKPEKVMDFFVNLPGVVKVWGHGTTKSSVRLKEGFDMDLRVIPGESYGAALQYFTGSKEHNIALRKIAIEQGYKLSEYGLFQGETPVAAKKEEEVYARLGLAWIPPDLREDRGEIDAALNGKLPDLIGYQDIKGEVHVHSNWNGGQQSIREIAAAAMKMGYEYVGISDHTQFLKIEHGLDEKQLRSRNKEIDEINQELKSAGHKFTVLKGCEANIMGDGSIDILDEVLAEMDFVIAGIHSQFKMDREEMTKRMITAMENPHVDIISHPTGRLLKKREEYDIYLDKILAAAQATKTVLEINAHPERLDLNDLNIHVCKKMGIKMVINTDTHQVDQLRLMPFGIAQARRGWAEKEDIINAWPVKKFLQMLK